MDAEAPPGPAPWESKEALVAVGTLIGIAASMSGVSLTADQIGALGVVLMMLLRLFANSGPIDWVRLTGRK